VRDPIRPADLVGEQFRRLYETSAYFHASVDQLAEHVLPAMADGLSVMPLDEWQQHDALHTASKAMVLGFAREAAAIDLHNGATLERMRRSLGPIPPHPFQ
jgi:hypothetical protein